MNGRVVEAGATLVANLIANSERLGREAARDFVLARDAATSSLGALVAAGPRVVRLAGCAARCAGRYRLVGASAHRANAEDIHRLCAELRGGVLKVGQLLSTRADLLPPDYVEVLSRLQDRAPALPDGLAAEVIESELGAPIDALFAAFDPEPIAAASLAQVHAARLDDGREVAVKVMVPGVEALVRADLAALEHLGAALGRELLPGIDTARLAAELARSIDAELDYLAEAAQLERFAGFASGDPRWRVPAVIHERSSRRVLTMERIEGVSLAAHLDRAGAAERDRLIGLIVELTAAQFLRHGAVHGDPHPGNFIVEPSGRLALLDFGCVLELSDAERLAYVRLIAAVLSRDAGALLSALAGAGFHAGSDEAMVELAELFLAGLDPAALADLDPRAQLERTLEILGSAGGVEVPPSFALIGRIFALLGGLVLGSQTRLDLGAIVMQVVGR